MNKIRAATSREALILQKQKKDHLNGPTPPTKGKLNQEEEKKEIILIPAELMKHIDELSIKLREQGVNPYAFRKSCIEEYLQLNKKLRYVNLKNMNGEQYAEWCKGVHEKVQIEKINEASFEFDSWPEVSLRIDAAADFSVPEIDLSIQIYGSVKKSGKQYKSEDKPLQNCKNEEYAAMQLALVKSVNLSLNQPIKNIQGPRKCVTDQEKLNKISLISVKAASSDNSNSSASSQQGDESFNQQSFEQDHAAQEEQKEARLIVEDDQSERRYMVEDQRIPKNDARKQSGGVQNELIGVDIADAAARLAERQEQPLPQIQEIQEPEQQAPQPNELGDNGNPPQVRQEELRIEEEKQGEAVDRNNDIDESDDSDDSDDFINRLLETIQDSPRESQSERDRVSASERHCVRTNDVSRGVFKKAKKIGQPVQFL